VPGSEENLRERAAELEQLLAASEARVAALDSLRRIAERVAAELQLAKLLPEILNAAVSISDAEAGAVLLLDEGTGELEFAVVRGGGGESLVGRRVPPGAGIVGWVVQRGEPLIVHDPASDPRFYPEISAESRFPTSSLLCVPMIAGGKTVGVLEVLNKRGDGRFSDDDASLLFAFATQAAIAIENARLYKALQDERDRILEVEQEVRRELARELHDGPAQTLASLVMRLRLLLRLLREGRAEAEAELEQVEPLAERALKEVRSLLFDLRPVILEARGLPAALEEYARRQGQEGFAVDLQVEGEPRRLDPKAERALFAIVREAIANARKHSAQPGAKVRLRFNEARLDVEVRDEGQGFDPGTVQERYAEQGSLGLLNMRERAQAIGAAFHIFSRPGQGTTVFVSVPYERS